MQLPNHSRTKGLHTSMTWMHSCWSARMLPRENLSCVSPGLGENSLPWCSLHLYHHLDAQCPPPSTPNNTMNFSQFSAAAHEITDAPPPMSPAAPTSSYVSSTSNSELTSASRSKHKFSALGEGDQSQKQSCLPSVAAMAQQEGGCHMHDQNYLHRLITFTATLPSSPPSSALILSYCSCLRPSAYYAFSPPSLTLLFISTYSSIIRRSFTLYHPFKSSFVSTPLIM